MLGWYIDVLIGFAVRNLIWLFRKLRSGNWPVQVGKVSSAICPPTGYGGPVAEICYTYVHNGEYYSGIHTKGFLLRYSAQKSPGFVNHPNRFPCLAFPVMGLFPVCS